MIHILDFFSVSNEFIVNYLGIPASYVYSHIIYKIIDPTGFLSTLIHITFLRLLVRVATPTKIETLLIALYNAIVVLDSK